MMKILYDPTLSCDGGKGGLRVMYPVSRGFLECNFVHSVVPEKNCDIWRMSVVNVLDETGAFLHRLTKGSAEWEMAIRLKERPDFIGGFNHGDEIGKSAQFILDGKPMDVRRITQPRDFSKLEIFVESTGYDPASPECAVLTHRKHFIYDENGIHLKQEVVWLEDVALDRKFKSFLAMMPPLKHLPEEEASVVTHSFSFDASALKKITRLPVEKKDVRSFAVTGDAYRFIMTADEYDPLYPNSYLALLTDNGNMNYHKMYVAFAGGSEDVIPKNTVWHSTTHYRIEKIESEMP